MVAKIKKKWQKSSKMFVCECCDYITSRKSSYEKHLESKKHKEQKLQSKNETFRCECCDYTTSKKYNYDKHLLTKRHKDTLQLFMLPNVAKFSYGVKTHTLFNKIIMMYGVICTIWLIANFRALPNVAKWQQKICKLFWRFWWFFELVTNLK